MLFTLNKHTSEKIRAGVTGVLVRCHKCMACNNKTGSLDGRVLWGRGSERTPSLAVCMSEGNPPLEVCMSEGNPHLEVCMSEGNPPLEVCVCQKEIHL